MNVLADQGLLFEFGFETAEEFDLETAEATAVTERQAPRLFKWLANGGYRAAFGEA